MAYVVQTSADGPWPEDTVTTAAYSTCVFEHLAMSVTPVLHVEVRPYLAFQLTAVWPFLRPLNSPISLMFSQFTQIQNLSIKAI